MDASRSRDDTPTRRKFYLLTLCAGTLSTLFVSLITEFRPFENYEDTSVFLVLVMLVGSTLLLWLKPSSLRVVELCLLGGMVAYDFAMLTRIMYVGPDDWTRAFIEGFLLWATFRYVWAFLVLGPKDGLKVSAGYLAGFVLLGLPYLFGATPARTEDLFIKLFLLAFPVTSTAYLTALYAFAHFLKLSVQAQAKAETAAELAYIDPLTNLPNRLLFEDRLEQSVAQAERAGRRFALIFIDLDRFKLVNDTLGHRAGDALLKEIGARMKARLRTPDTLARISGDEFAVILHEVEAPQAAEVAAIKLLSAFDKPFDLGGVTRYAGASLGIALHPEHGVTPDDLLAHADSAMYRAKGRGRCCYQVYETERQAGVAPSV